MDKYEVKLSLEEINRLIQERRYGEAADIADGIDWNHFRSTTTLRQISEVYKAVGDYDRSRDVMAIALKREPDNPAVIYSLCELTIYLYGRDGLQADLASSLQLMQDYAALEPNNPKRLILQYKFYAVSGVSDREKIEVLEQLRREKFSARWGYELAKCYAAAGENAAASQLCVEVSELFGGRYGDRALELLEELRESEKRAAEVAGVGKDEPEPQTSPRQEMQASGMQRRMAPSEPQPGADDRGESVRERYADERPVRESGRDQKPERSEYESRNAAGAEDAPQDSSGRLLQFPGRDGETPPASEAGRENSSGSVPAAGVPEREEFANDVPASGADREDSTKPISAAGAGEEEPLKPMSGEKPAEQEDFLNEVSAAKASAEEAAFPGNPVSAEPAGQGNLDQTGRQASINEVMAEWERIRADIRRANDEKRTQRILEDTGAILQDFEETARHSLLEDIEKGVARQRRQVRSGMYRTYNEESEEPAERPVRRAAVVSEGETLERPVRRTVVSDEEPAERPVRSTSAVRGEDPAGPVRRTQALQEEEPLRDDEDLRGETTERPIRRAVPVSNEDDDVRVYGRTSDIDTAATRRWNSEEIHRLSGRSSGETSYPGEEEVFDGEPAVGREAEGDAEEDRRAESVSRRAQEDRRSGPSDREERTEEAPREEAAAEQENANGPQEPVRRVRRVRRMKAGEDPYAWEESGSDREPAAGPEAEKDTEEDRRAESVSGQAQELRRSESADQAAETAQMPQEEAFEEETPEPQRDRERDRSSAPEEPARGQREERKEAAREQETRPSAAQERPEVSHTGKRELTREERRLFGPFCRMPENVNQLTEALDQISLASSAGNLLIMGNEQTADRVARGILDVVRRSDANFTGKVARAAGESLNRLDVKGISDIFRKLESGALIVTRAADIAPKTMERLHNELEREHGIILIFTDSGKRMETFRRENGAFLGSFQAVINIRPLDDKALVAYARDYALSQDYSIDEFGQLALAQRISSMQGPDHHVSLKEVRDLVDEAIGYASKKSPKTVMDIISRKRYDEDDRIILHEKDFMHY